MNESRNFGFPIQQSRRFAQAKFADDGSIFGSNQLSLLSKLPLKISLDLKVVKIDPKLIILLL